MWRLFKGSYTILHYQSSSTLFAFMFWHWFWQRDWRYLKYIKCWSQKKILLLKVNYDFCILFKSNWLQIVWTSHYGIITRALVWVGISSLLFVARPQKLSNGKPFCYFGSIIIAILALSPQADGNLSSSQKKSLVAQGELT